MTHIIGIDIGSTTAKVVALDGAGELCFSAYRRHKAETIATLGALLGEAQAALGERQGDPGDGRVRLLVTGSAGMGICEQFELPFIQEVVASAEVVKRLYPQVHTLIDIGGEDAKMIFFDAQGAPDIRMNGSCAGGTGAFIDEMAMLLNVPVSEIESLARQSTEIYPLASRCGVFAKTDLQNLLSRDVPPADIAASVLRAVVYQILSTLARGYRPTALLLFSGGPLTFIPALRSAFLQELGLGEEAAVEIERAELLTAHGAALAAMNPNGPAGEFDLEELIQRLASPPTGQAVDQRRLQPLFDDPIQRQRWEAARMQQRLPRVEPDALASADCFLGVDSGSTTSKVVLVDGEGRVAFSYYAGNKGNPIGAVQQGLQALAERLAACPLPPRIAYSIVTGYGEDLIRSAFAFDQGMVETLAHFRAARAFDEQVSFILDIGGQDMKAIFVENGYIQNIEINEACSSGCGSFIESFAASMGYPVSQFAELACESQAPCDLGSRCTVFMNSRVKQALREAASVGDISAGLAYSVIKNALHKVLKITDPAVLGEHIVVQGGAFRNPAVHKAFEHLVGRPVTCPDLAELMGAYGAALSARDAYYRLSGGQAQCAEMAGAGSQVQRTEGMGGGAQVHRTLQVQRTEQVASSFIGLENLALASEYQRKQIRCRGCENRCQVTRLAFPHAQGNVFYTGNRCERIYTNRGQRLPKGRNAPAEKLRLLFERPMQPQSDPPGGSAQPRLTIGVPRVLNMYENFPFWHALLLGCGFAVQLSDPSGEQLFKSGAASVMSENICFPAKLVHGHILNLVEKGVDRIFYPMVYYEQDEFSDAANCFNCPIVAGYPDVVRSAIDPQGVHGIPLDQPTVSFQEARLLERACWGYLKGLGVRRRVFKRALQGAYQAQQAYKDAVRAQAGETLAQARADGRQVILMLGRPYHLDPLINHGLPGILADFGVDVITEDSLPLPPEATLENRHVLTQWEYLNRYYYAARWAGQQDDVEVVQLNSFACGPDAYTMDEVKSILRSYGKCHTVVRIDEIESTGSIRLRLRSLIETLKAHQNPERVFTPRKSVRLYLPEDRHKKVLAPYFSQFCAPTVSGPLIDLGYPVETLPPPDRESVEIGLKYTQNEICYPGIIVIGDLIKALQSGQYDPEQVAVGAWQTGGQCRASSILSLLKRALIAAGFEHVPVVALTTNRNLHEQPGFDLNLKDYISRALMACIYSDSISAMYYASVVREEVRGQAQALAGQLLEPLAQGKLILKRDAVLERLEGAVEAFNGIATRSREYPRVGIVGEIYAKFNDFVNNRVAQWLIDQEVEVVVPPLLEFFSGWFVAANVRVRENLVGRDLSWLLANVLDHYVSGVLEDVEAVRSKFKHYRPGHNIHDIARRASQALKLTHQYGEGWLIAGEIGELVRQGTQNVLCLQPFGCIANQVIAKGVEKRIKALYPNLNLLFLDLDAGVSEVNYFNRMYFFVDRAKS
ncbi:MAG: acyl-CoA dehydratase activase-related protein [Chloroflexota bacterium]